MSEDNKKVSARISNRGKKTSGRNTGNSRKKNTQDESIQGGIKKYFNPKDGLRSEILGLLSIFVGIFLIITFLSENIGSFGLWFREFNFMLFGVIGWIIPIFLIILGFLIILKRAKKLLTKKNLGIFLFILSIMIFYTARITYISDGNSLMASIKIIATGENRPDGGIIGYILALPIYRLLGYTGTILVGIILVLVSLVLILNTSFYDSLIKTREIKDEADKRIRERMERRKNQNINGDEIVDRDEFLEESFNSKVPVQIHADEIIRARENGEFTEKTKKPKKSFLEKLGLQGFDEDESSEENTFNEKVYNNKMEREKKVEPTINRSFKINNQYQEEPKDSYERVSIPYFMKKNRSSEIPYEEDYVRSSNVRSGFNFELKENEADEKGRNASHGNEVENLRINDEIHTERIPLAREKVPPVNFEPLKPFDKEQALKEEDLGRHNSKNVRINDLKNIKEVEIELSEAEKVEIVKNDKENSKKDEKKKQNYRYPEIGLLRENIKGMLANEDRREIQENASKLEETLLSFGVEASVKNVSKGPSVTRYELQPKAGIKVSKIVNLADDIALSLAASGVRIEAPIPGKPAIGIEIPNKEQSPVFLREVIQSEKFQKSSQKIAIALGKDITGESVVGDLSKFPHVLIAGATGSGKSVCINSLIISILYKYTPEEVRLIMVDPKVVELNVYNGIPHLLIPVVTEPKKAAGALNWAVNEMTRRYHLFAEHNVKNIEGFNEQYDKGKVNEKLPYIVMIIDELADLMMVSANEVEDYIARLAQMARAAGMHLVIATQRPSVDVITGVIKANIPSRISFAVSSAIDSRTILDQNGAEKLLGRGDMLFYPSGNSKPRRVQGAFISEEEVETIVNHVKKIDEGVEYDNSILEHIEKGNKSDSFEDDRDELFNEAVRIVVENGQASTSFLQRKMRIGYNRAARIMDELEAEGVISGPDGSKPRKVIWSISDIE